MEFESLKKESPGDKLKKLREDRESVFIAWNNAKLGSDPEEREELKARLDEIDAEIKRLEQDKAA